jgi:hypothetical protein
LFRSSLSGGGGGGVSDRGTAFYVWGRGQIVEQSNAQKRKNDIEDLEENKVDVYFPCT